MSRSDSESYSDASYVSDNDSEFNFISNYVFEEESHREVQVNESDSDEDGVYRDEPLADGEWMENYREQRRMQKERDEKLEKRFNGVEPTDSWCNCGHCRTDNLQKASECVCCAEIESCVTSLSDELVMEDVSQPPTCVTQHPGFQPVCLEKWSLRVSAEKHRCRDGSKYTQRGSEARFLRSVAYRSFTYLVHGYQGRNRIALPACAYSAIRNKFRDENEDFTGFEDIEDYF